MNLYGRRVFEQQDETVPEMDVQAGRRQAGKRLRTIAAVMLTLAAGVPSGFAQQTVGAGASAPDKAASDLPAAPAPALTQPLDLRTSARNFSKPAGRLLGDPINLFRPTTIPKASFANSVRLTDMVKDGKIYLSLSDAIALALENNYDIAIARYDLDIADTDILRTKTGAAPLGAPSGLIQNTLGGSSSTLRQAAVPAEPRSVRVALAPARPDCRLPRRARARRRRPWNPSFHRPSRSIARPPHPPVSFRVEKQGRTPTTLPTTRAS
jgi:hypothetical protein